MKGHACTGDVETCRTCSNRRDDIDWERDRPSRTLDRMADDQAEKDCGPR